MQAFFVFIEKSELLRIIIIYLFPQAQPRSCPTPPAHSKCVEFTTSTGQTKIMPKHVVIRIFQCLG